MKLMKYILPMIALIMISTLANAQGWVNKYSPDKEMRLSTIGQLEDSSYWVSGFDLTTFGSTRLMRISPDGIVLQAFDYDSISGGFSKGHITPDKGMAIISPLIPDSLTSRIHRQAVLRTDSAGNKMWLRTINEFYLPTNVTGLSGNLSIDTTDDNGFICTLNPHDTTAGKPVITVIRIDEDGNVLWNESFYDTFRNAYVYNAINSKDGGFIVQANGFRDGSIPYSRIFKLDANGNFLWEYISSFYSGSANCFIAKDNNIIVYSSDTTDRTFIAKIDQSGNELWFADIDALPDSSRVGWLIELDNETFAGVTFNPQQPSQGKNYGFIQFDTAGTQYVFKYLPTSNVGTNLQLLGAVFTKTADAGYVLGGWINYPNQQPNSYLANSFLIKMDSTGQVFPSTISGYAYYDRDADCVIDSSEEQLDGKVISFSNSIDTFRTMTADSGYYSLGVNPGTYNVAIDVISPYWEQVSCNPTQVSLSTGDDTLVSFGFDALANLPYITIDAHMRPRFCASNVYTIEYCNTGPGTFVGIVNLEFDSILQVDSASVTLIPQANNHYLIVESDGLAVTECRTVKVYYSVPCDPAINLSTVCVQAHAYSDSVVNISPQWDMSNLKVDVLHNALTDSVEFIIENIGTGDMVMPQPLIVIEDNVIMASQNLQLLAGGIYRQTLPANGSTWRARITQTPFNPHSAFSTAAIEGAGVNQNNTFSTGFINQFPINGQYAFDYTTCEQIRNSYDPNQKTVYPEGIAPDHIIDSTTQLEYTIDFQNTGNDTAYIVRIVDTLAAYLDPATIKLGVSSHRYSFKFLSSNVIEFTFEAIHLPDSTTDEPGSKGFVKFKIDQVANNANGVVIDNDVAIYFDYNAPIITNIARVVLGSYKLTDIETIGDIPNLNINAWPNPFTDHATIEVQGITFDKLELVVYDMSGRVVQRKLALNTNLVNIDGAGLGSGTYIFQLIADGKAVGRGKVVLMP